MVESIVPGDDIVVSLKGFTVECGENCKIKMPNGETKYVSAIRVIYDTSGIVDSDNIRFEQNANLSEKGISITTYGLVIIPMTNLISYPIEIPIKVQNKTGVLSISETDFAKIFREDGYAFRTSLVAIPI